MSRLSNKDWKAGLAERQPNAVRAGSSGADCSAAVPLFQTWIQKNELCNMTVTLPGYFLSCVQFQSYRGSSQCKISQRSELRKVEVRALARKSDFTQRQL